MYYRITWHETDGNDCTVYETIVQASTEDSALEHLHTYLQQQCPEAEDGGGDFLDFYFPCDCDTNSDAYPDMCDGHGGTSLREVEAFTDDPGKGSIWHVEYSIPTQ